MTNFFLEELRKIYGDGRVIHDPQFVGECCYGSLGDLRVKARFTKDIVANQYPYLTVSILNPTKGEIDSVRMKIGGRCQQKLPQHKSKSSQYGTAHLGRRDNTAVVCLLPRFA